MGKNRQMNIRLSDADYEKIQSIASKTNRTVSELLRDHINKIAVKDSKPERIRNINLNRINANLNMIAKWVNTHKELADSLKVIELLINIERQVKEL
ncbi:MAG TPA: plasmid mobilization protein [Arsenophonus nasoniae]|uniref:plasmid mobilization protein n=1 Tax=Arsenophonus nasoniae TaxID=638 RepID=UPI0038792CE9